MIDSPLKKKDLMLLDDECNLGGGKNYECETDEEDSEMKLKVVSKDC
jgi:hypothetical protein